MSELPLPTLLPLLLLPPNGEARDEARGEARSGDPRTTPAPARASGEVGKPASRGERAAAAAEAAEAAKALGAR
jgi:hypothetical protein